jgi:Zn-dependent metalloprotease
MVFPIGPKLSELQEELLRGLLGDGSLANSKFTLTSTDGVAVREENGAFAFSPTDERFDHVQSYFFIQKTLDFAETFWKFNLPFPLRVQLKAGYPEKTNTAFYYKGQVRIGDGDGVSYQAIPRDPSIVTHEVIHSIIESLSGMGTESETGSLNEGFADFLTAAIWDNPTMGHTAFKKGPYKRTVSNTITLAEKNGGLYHDSGILSGTFWEIRYTLGTEKSQLLALKTITRLGVQPKFSDLKPAVIDAMKSLGWSIVDSTRVEDILNNRGW